MVSRLIKQSQSLTKQVILFDRNVSHRLRIGLVALWLPMVAYQCPLVNHWLLIGFYSETLSFFLGGWPIDLDYGVYLAWDHLDGYPATLHVW